MKITKKSESLYHVSSESDARKHYEINIEKNTCTCINYIMRQRQIGGSCKHIIATRNNIQKQIEPKCNDVIGFIQASGGKAEAIALYEKFGDKLIDQMLKQGDLIEPRAGTIMEMK